MIRSQSAHTRQLWQLFFGVSAALILMIATTTDAFAQRRNNDEPEVNPEDRTLSAQIGEQVLEAQAILQPEDDNAPINYQAAISILNAALQDDPNPYERSILLRLRGNAKFGQDNVQGAVEDFLAVIETGALTREEENTFRINVGQLYMILDRVPEGIEQIELALNNGAELNSQLAKFMAQAHAQLDRWQGGLRYAEFYYENTNNKALNDYNLLQAYYNQLNRTQDELRVVRALVDAYPEEISGWQNLIALFAALGREEDAYEINKMMYLNGLFTCEDGNRLLNLAQYYSFYENPYRGATILERELNAGCVEETVQNLETLANMWRQAAEFERAIPVLERISDIRGDGDTALKLAEALYQLNRFEESAVWFERALNRGGLDETGEAWVLLGTVRFELGDRQGAINAFEQGARFPSSRRSANDWARFVRGQIAAEAARRTRLQQVQIDECNLILEQEADLITLVGDPSDFNELGQPILDVPDRCTRWFNVNGVQIRLPNQTDEEAAEYAEEQIEIAREQAEQALARAG